MRHGITENAARMCNLARDGDLGRVLVAERGAGAVGVVEDDGDGCLGDSGLALLVDELLERGGAHLAQIGDAEHEADGVEDVGLAGAVEASDGVEQRVEPRHHRPPRIRLEALQAYLLDVHLAGRRRRHQPEIGARVWSLSGKSFEAWGFRPSGARDVFEMVRRRRVRDSEIEQGVNV
jgi:hypothetical protein